MKADFKIYIFGMILASCLNIGKGNCQIFSDTSSFKIVEKCIDDIYNFRFDEARDKCTLLNTKYPGHSAILLLNGMTIYWENYPMPPKSLNEKTYIDYMQKAIRLSEKKDSPENEPEFLLVNLCSRGMLLQYYSDIDNMSEILPLIKSTYQRIRRAFKYTSAYDDFYYFTGLYNYYREAYPEAYPIYKTFIYLFPRGNKTEGLREMQIASTHSVLLKAEAFSFLAWISTSFEHDFQLATTYSRKLSELYPQNTVFLLEYIKNLLLTKQYEEAEILLNSRIKGIRSSFFLAEFEIFNGILQEKEYHNLSEAQRLYVKGLAEISPFSGYGYEYSAYAYFGLSRISDAKGDKKGRKTYHKKAVDLAVFKNLDFGN